VLDAARGKPASGVNVSLLEVSSGATAQMLASG
jgi:5-hydroxyisourate hydrolase-like protein (transthyretin family)